MAVAVFWLPLPTVALQELLDSPGCHEVILTTE